MKEKLLIVSLNIPYPLVHGGAIAQYYFLKNLTKQFDIFFCSFITSERGKEQMEGLQQLLPAMKVISIFQRTDKEQTSGWYRLLRRTFLAGKRMLRQKGIKETDNSREEDGLSHFGMLLNVFPAYFIHALNELIRKESIKIIQLEFYDTLSLLKAIPAGCKKVFVHHEICTRRLELAYANSKYPAAYKNYVVESVRGVENSFLSAADCVIVFNEEDKNYLKGVNPTIRVSPFGIPDDLIAREAPDQEYDHLLFMGGQSHLPNVEGLRWLLEKAIEPGRGNFDIPLHIIGNWDEAFRKQFEGNVNIQFLGQVERVDAYLGKAVMVAPIFSGSGLRTKILYALANQVPVISTTFAAEGLFSRDKADHVCLLDDGDDFVKKIKSLFANQPLLTNMAKLGKQFYEENFSAEQLITKRVEVLKE